MAYTVTIEQWFSGFYAQRSTEPASTGATLQLKVSATQSDGSTLPSTLFWDITRTNNTSEPIANDWSVNSGSVALSGNATLVSNYPNSPLVATITGDIVDETYLQGETFSINVRSSAGGTIVATHAFTLYDVDQNVTVAYNGTIGTNGATTDPTYIALEVTQNRVSGAHSLSTARWLKDGVNISGAFWPNVLNQTIVNNLNSTVFPDYGATSTYKIQVNNGLQWYDAGQVAIYRGMKKPISNGANVLDETVIGDVSVEVGFADVGEGQEFWKRQSTVNTNPAISDSGWVSVGSTGGSYTFTQPRGTIRYYHTRWTNEDDSLQLIGSTTGNPSGTGPVSERVPSIPSGLSVSFNTAGTQATLSATIPSSDTVTSIYYYMSTSSTQPVFQAATTTQTDPASHWQSSNVFTVTPGTLYFFYALGWTHNNPGRDGAAITSYISQTAPTANAVQDFGMEVYASNNTKIILNTTRGARELGSGTTSNITSGSSVQTSFTGLQNTYNFQLLISPNNAPIESTLSDSWDVVKGTNAFTITNNMGRTSSFDYIVMRTG